MEEIISAVKYWAQERGIIRGATTNAQMLKLVEEVGELASAIAKDKKSEMANELGDVIVVLIILAEMNYLDFEGCAKAALEKIQMRKGRMLNGVWVKEEDIKND